jgi:ATP-dependent DNA helicase PIF1
VEKDAEFRAASAAAPRLDAVAVAEKQQAFATASAAKPSRAAGSEPARPRMPWTPQGSALDAIRATHAKAYAPWTRDEDGDLKRRHQAGERVDAIAAAFGRKPGAIRSRLKKLGLV